MSGAFATPISSVALGSRSVASRPACSRQLSSRGPTSVPVAPVRMMTSTSASTTLTTPSRVVPTPLPQVYVYDHCPFCVRVRHVLGLKNVKYNLIYLMNDDVDTPTSLIGKKMVPIFQAGGPNTSALGESLDICEAVDTNPDFGTPNLLAPQSSRDDIPSLLDAMAMPLRRLTRPRFAWAKLPEFSFADGAAAYIRNHPLKDPESYQVNYDNSPIHIAEVQPHVDALADLIFCEEFCTEGGLSYDDVVLFPKLRSLTIIKGLVIPSKIREYLEYHSQRAEVMLYDHLAS